MLSTKTTTENNKFAFDLYNKLRTNQENQEKNLFFSPFSILTALAMVYAGAKGRTKKQMAETCRFNNESLFDLSRYYLYWCITEGKGYELKVHNKLFGEKSFRFSRDFIGQTLAHYAGSLEAVNFKDNHEEARQIINEWVAEKTNNKIKDIIPVGMLDPDTRLVAANAIYFKGSWLNKFEKDLTDLEAKFFKTDGNIITTPLMYTKSWVRYGESSNFQVIELPYMGNELSMIVALPTCEQMYLVEDYIDQAFNTTLSMQEVEIYLPRFKVNFAVNFSDILKEIGITDAFSPNDADFSDMVEDITDPDQSLYLSEVRQKASIETTEEGAEAATATTAIVNFTGCMPPLEPNPVVPVFKADHPFMFGIKDNDTDRLLFLGKIEDPSI